MIEKYNENYYRDAILAAIFGDNLALPYEGKTRSYMGQNRVEDLEKEYHKRKEIEFRERDIDDNRLIWGLYSNHSSMIVATLDSLKDGYDLDATMKKFVGLVEDGKYTPIAREYGLDSSTEKSVARYLSGIKAKQCGCIKDHENGNGSLRRILPFSLYHYRDYRKNGIKSVLAKIYDDSALTHAHLKSKLACGIYSFVLFEILDYRLRLSGIDSELAERTDRKVEKGQSKIDKEEETLKRLIEKGLDKSYTYYREKKDVEQSFSSFAKLYKRDYFEKSIDEIDSSGYVICSLEAALYILAGSTSLEDGYIKAINLGKDTDGIASIYGGLAGIYYGISEIDKYKESLVGYEEILNIIDINFSRSGLV